MKAQHAPTPGVDIWSQHSLREFAVKIELEILHSKKGGIIVHNNHKEINVKNVFSGDENKFFLTQASGPVVLMGGGQSGWVPGR